MRVRSCRWPRLRFEFCRRRFLKAMTLGPRSWATISPVTVAPLTKGAPNLVSSVSDEHEHFGEGDRVTQLTRQAHDRDGVFRGDAVLLAACLDDSEHDVSFSVSDWRGEPHDDRLLVVLGSPARFGARTSDG